MSDINLLDQIKNGFGLKNDSELAGFLNVTRTTIHNIRFKGSRLGIKPRLVVLDKIAFFKIREWGESLSSESLANKIRSSSEFLSRRLANSRTPSDAEAVAEIDLIEIIKVAFQFDNDAELAEFLGVARNTISMVRSGRSNLGPKPRLKILNRINSFDLEKVESVLESTDELIEAVRQWTSNQKNVI